MTNSPSTLIPMLQTLELTGKDVSDATEIATNRAIANTPARFDPTAAPMRARRILADIEQMVTKLPTQQWRDEEQSAFQQYSTPPHMAYVVVWAANLDKRDIVLEPSAGCGGLVCFALNSGATVFANEISDRRYNLLRQLPIRVFKENAEQLHNILDPAISPTAVVMNPPFSTAGTRMGDKRVRGAGLEHIEQALLRLRPGGRLVTIIGDRRDGDDGSGRGMIDADSWRELRSKYAVRASIGLGREIYRKMGTTFPSRLVVIDKVKPDPATLVVDVTRLQEAIGYLTPIREMRDRASAQNAPIPVSRGLFDSKPKASPVKAERKPKAKAKVDPVQWEWPEFVAKLPDEYRQRLSMAMNSPCAETWSDVTGITIRPPHQTVWQRVLEIDPEFPRTGRRKDQDGNIVREWDRIPSTELLRKAIGMVRREPETPRRDYKCEPIEIAVAPVVANRAPLKDVIFEPYVPQRLVVPGAMEHPTPLVESAAMASVLPPVPTYRPMLPKELVTNGVLSIAQLEAAVYIGQAHEQFLEPQLITPPGTNEQRLTRFRKGAFLADSTGVGKGRTLCAVIMDSFARGETKAFWVSKTSKLYRDAVRDWTALGNDAADVIRLSDYKATDALPSGGILFATYGLMRSKSKDGTTRMQQITKWLGEFFSGVIALDESHGAKNSTSE